VKTRVDNVMQLSHLCVSTEVRRLIVLDISSSLHG
jgi:hypothetical protein